jgi:hypothetical protein
MTLTIVDNAELMMARGAVVELEEAVRGLSNSAATFTEGDHFRRGIMYAVGRLQKRATAIQQQVSEIEGKRR